MKKAGADRLAEGQARLEKLEAFAAAWTCRMLEAARRVDTARRKIRRLKARLRAEASAAADASCVPTGPMLCGALAAPGYVRPDAGPCQRRAGHGGGAALVHQDAKGVRFSVIVAGTAAGSRPCGG